MELTNIWNDDVNVGKNERRISSVAGGALLYYGLKRGKPAGLLMALLGGELLYSSITGHNPIYAAMGVNTAKERLRQTAGVPHENGVKTEETVVINCPPNQLYKFWRNFENLAVLMPHIESIKNIDEKVSHWVVKGPHHTPLQWTCEVINDIENSLIAWRSLPGSDINQAGSILFENMPNNRGTKVTVAIRYIPPAGPVGQATVRLTGRDPLFQIAQSLRKFKQLMETGEIATTTGQPTGSPQEP